MIKKKLTAEDWLAKYYPVPADEVSARKAVAHSLQKWRGLRPAVLARYGLHVEHRNIYDGIFCILEIDAYSCSLCRLYLDHDAPSSTYCVRCPLFKARGKVQCSSETPWERSRSLVNPWLCWAYNHDPEPMIRALERTLKFVKSKRTRKTSA